MASACGNPFSAATVSDRVTARQSEPRAYRDYLSVTAWPRDTGDVQALWRAAEHVLSPHDPGVETHELVITEQTLARLRTLGIPLRVEAANVQALIDADADRMLQPAEPTLYHAGKLNIFGSFFDQVQTLDALAKYLDELAAASQGRAQVVMLGNSVENRPVRAIRISSAPEGTDRASVIVTGTQHAREWASPMVTTGLADALVRQYGADAQVKRIVDTLEIFIIPVVNPDGYFASHNGRRLQRKNMNPRCNVDLNRNWGEWWGMGVPRDGCNEETYPGQSAFSEPETQAVRRLVESRKNLRFYMDYHSAANQVMYPLCFVQSPAADSNEDRMWSELYARSFTGVNGANIPSRSCFGIGGGQGGCSTDYFRKRLPNTLEIELRSGGSLGGFGLTNDLVLPFVEENWMGWVNVLAKVADKYPATGLPDAGTDAEKPHPDAGSGDTGPDTGGADAPASTPADAATTPPGAADGPTPSDTRGPTTPPVQPPPSTPAEHGGCAIAPTERGQLPPSLVLVLLLGLVVARRTRR